MQSTDLEKEHEVTPLKHSRNLAARMGRWSAGHWKTAVVAWFAFVFLALFAGMQVGTKTIDPNDRNVGESRTADHIIDEAGFNVDRDGETVEEQGEMVLFQATSKSVTVHDPAFRAAIADADRTLSKFRQVRNLRSPLDPAESDLISKDRRSALIQFTPKGTYEEGVLYIDKLVTAVDKVEARHPGFLIDETGSVSTEKEARECDPGRPQDGRPRIDPAHDHRPDDRPRVVRRSPDPAAPRHHFGDRHDGPDRVREPPRADEPRRHGSRPADRAGGRRRLRALLHQARA